MLQHKVRFVGLPDVFIKSKSKICLGTSLTPFVDEVFPRLSIVRMLIVPPCGVFFKGFTHEAFERKEKA